MKPRLKVWIDQDLCTGDGLCEEIAPAVFRGSDDGLFYVKEQEWPDLSNGNGDSDPIYRMGEGQANVPAGMEEAVIEAAEECPGECIFIEME